MKNRKNIFINILAAGIIVFTFFSCKDCIEGNNQSVSEVRDFEYFNGIITDDEYFVTITQDTAMSADSIQATFFAESNILPYVITYVADNSLVIRNQYNRCFKKFKRITVQLTVKDLEYIQMKGSGRVHIENYILQTNANKKGYLIMDGNGEMIIEKAYGDYYDILNSGSGLIEIRDGFCNEVDYELNGSGDILADFFQTEYCNFDLYGTGDIWLYATRILSGEIANEGGYVYYRQSPSVKINVVGFAENVFYIDNKK